MSDETRFAPGPQFRLGPGTRLNGIYEIERFITAGGMGEIYKGRAIETGDSVAIKTIRPDLAQVESAMMLFRKEASALRHLYHEAIVRYFVFSIDPVLNLPYLAMDYVEGESLSELVARGPLDTQQLRILTHRLAQGLHAAHRLGIIHRDLSPDNILVPEGDVTNAKIIDFGIARSPLGDGTVIGSGFAGKLNYVSPEQLGLFGGEVGPPSDIYSLGLVIAGAARGRHLDMGHSHVEVIDRRRSVPDLGGIDPAIRAVLARMLQPNPKDRPQSMADVETWMPRMEARPPKRRIGFWAGSVAAALLLAGAGTAAFVSGALDFGRAPHGGNSTEMAKPPTRIDPDAAGLPPAGASPDGPATDAAAPLEPPAPNSRPAAPPPPGPAANLDPPSVPPPPPPPPQQQQDAPSAPAPAPQAVSVDQVHAFLRGYAGGECFFIAPVTVAARETIVEAYGASPTPFMAFDEAFQRILGFEPEINLRQVTAAQCPLVDYLGNRGNQRNVRKPSLTLKSDTLRSGDELVASTDAKANRHVDILLVSNDGIVHSLAGYTKRSGDTLSASLKLVGSGQGGDATPQLVVVLASAKPLTGLLTEAKSGAMTADRLAKLLAADAAAGSGTGIAVKYVKLANGT